MFSFFSNRTPIQNIEKKIADESAKIFREVYRKYSGQPEMFLSLIMLEAYGSTYQSFKSKEMYQLNKKAFKVSEAFSYDDYVTLVETVVKKEISRFIKLPESNRDSEDDFTYPDTYEGY